MTTSAGQPAGLIADDIHAIVTANAARLDAEVAHRRDFDLDFFAFKTLERSYLFRRGGAVAERPQHMLMRVAVGIHRADIAAACETYRLMSERRYIHASPALFNAGTPRPQLSSCFLAAMKEDSVEGVCDTLKECASIAKASGGVGLHAHNVRATGSAPTHNSCDACMSAGAAALFELPYLRICVCLPVAAGVLWQITRITVSSFA